MASFVTSYISSAFCSHKKVQVYILSKCMLSNRPARIGAFDEGYQSTQQVEAAERYDSQQQKLAEENGRSFSVEGPPLEESGEERFRNYSSEEDKTVETHDAMEGPALKEGTAGRLHEYSPEEEERNVYNIQNGESSSSYSVPSSPEAENESVSAFSAHGNPSREPFEEQGQGLAVEERHEEMGSSHTELLEETWRESPTYETTEAGLQAETAEKPFTDLDTCKEHLQEEAESSSGKGMLDKEDEFSRGEFTEMPELEEGKQSCSAHEMHRPWERKEAMTVDLHSNRDEEPESLAVGSEAALFPNEEEGPLSEDSSFTGQPPHAVSHGSSEPQDRVQQEQKILAEINAIKKIVGYEGELHASIRDQISTLYAFLGMEPYYWAVEVDEFEKALAEIELLKVVVGVK